MMAKDRFGDKALDVCLKMFRLNLKGKAIAPATSGRNLRMLRGTSLQSPLPLLQAEGILCQSAVSKVMRGQLENNEPAMGPLLGLDMPYLPKCYCHDVGYEIPW